MWDKMDIGGLIKYLPLFSGAGLFDTAQHKRAPCPGLRAEHGGMKLGFATAPLREKIL